jgi:hypothetical protein
MISRQKKSLLSSLFLDSQATAPDRLIDCMRCDYEGAAELPMRV